MGSLGALLLGMLNNIAESVLVQRVNSAEELSHYTLRVQYIHWKANALKSYDFQFTRFAKKKHLFFTERKNT